MRDRKNKRKSHLTFAAAIFSVAMLFFIPRGYSKAKTFADNFSRKCALDEAGSMRKSNSSNWWVNSGGQLKCLGGRGRTIQNDLPKSSEWRKLYEKNNSEDTDEGKHPQNIFRLITRTRWQNFTEQAYFKINKINLSSSKNRNESNGILLFDRYVDSDNLYYAGVRVDGYAVIKKKIAGEYFTLTDKKIYGQKKYDIKCRPNLLPQKRNIGIKTEIRNTEDGNVDIKLYVANGRKGSWVLYLEALDEPGKYGGDVISQEGYAGIRTDFMDVEFDKYQIKDLEK